MDESIPSSEIALQTKDWVGNRSDRGGLGRTLKRALDCLIAATLLLPVGLLFVGIALAIKFDDSGPIFYKQKRHGIGLKPFYMWKFRSMKVVDNDVFSQATKFDGRVTRVGAFLRRTSLDELPQLINVLRGEMSLVGPRPHAVVMDNEFDGLIENYRRRYCVRPGITGLAQIRGFRGETENLQKMQDRVDADNEYIDRWSVILDLKILALTPVKGLLGPNIY